MNRYVQLFDIVNELQPKHAVEIGTWTGKRAAEWYAATNCIYTGFDLFEDGSKENDEEEFNVKGHTVMVDVARSMEMTGIGKYKLIRGNTRIVLPKMVVGGEITDPDIYWMPNFDFCFIDGGHSKETIENDFDWVYANIDEGGTIILDDHYTPEQDGFGCNLIDGEVLPPGDSVSFGKVSLMRVVK